jgi:hypothetical protein
MYILICILLHYDIDTGTMYSVAYVVIYAIPRWLQTPSVPYTIINPTTFLKASKLVSCLVISFLILVYSFTNDLLAY